LFHEVERLQQLPVLVCLARMQWALMPQQVLQDELMLQHLHGEFFRRFLSQKLVQGSRRALMRVCELGESHMHLLVVKLVQLQLVQEAVLRVLQRRVQEVV
jgi:hypothetical protein